MPLPLLASTPSPTFSPRFPHLPDLGDDFPELSTPAFIGIMIAISGNVLISLALNLQKLAHKRVGQTKRRNAPAASAKVPVSHSPDLASQPRYGVGLGVESQPSATSAGNGQTSLGEAQPLIPFPSTPIQYGIRNARLTETVHGPSAVPKRSSASRPVYDLARFKDNQADVDDTSADANVAGDGAERVVGRHGRQLSVIEEDNETEYLKSNLWWLGFLLMNLGEMGNFISYAWAPASVVAPLGTFSLVANCFFAPLLLNERFRTRDLFGIFIAVIGAVTVVIASSPSDTKLDPDTLLRAISQQAFIVYSGIYIVGGIVLAGLSQGSIGRQWVIVDVGLCALFGGFTVLSTKAISTLLTMEWMEMFTQWITYPVLAVLILTGVGQIRYLNRALMHFDSKVVIPVQFVLFTLSAIIGSAILYGDFRKAKFHQVVTFLYGCAATFAGVFIIAWTPVQEETENVEGLEGLENDSTDALSNLTVTERRLLGTIGRRRRGGNRRRDNSVPGSPALSLIGLSPAQHLLLVHTPPSDAPVHGGITAADVGDRRRTMSWLDELSRDGLIRGPAFENGLAHRYKVSTGSLRGNNFDHTTYQG